MDELLTGASPDAFAADVLSLLNTSSSGGALGLRFACRLTAVSDMPSSDLMGVSPVPFPGSSMSSRPTVTSIESSAGGFLDDGRRAVPEPEPNAPPAIDRPAETPGEGAQVLARS